MTSREYTPCFNAFFFLRFLGRTVSISSAITEIPCSVRPCLAARPGLDLRERTIAPAQDQLEPNECWRSCLPLWRKSHRAMAENILVWRKFLKTRTNHIYVFFWPSSHLSLSSLETIPASSARRALRGTPDAKGRA